MIFSLKGINKTEWMCQIKRIGHDQKWFISIFYHFQNEHFSVYIESENEQILHIGACTFSKLSRTRDCSIFLFPEYRRKGHARQLILDLIARYENIQFTVSTYNTISSKLFDSIPVLKKTETNIKNKTYTYLKVD